MAGTFAGRVLLRVLLGLGGLLGSDLCRATFSIRLLDLLESADHRRIVSAQMRHNPMKPVPMIVCLGYRSVSAFCKYPL
jgi:hypothetical protein